MVTVEYEDMMRDDLEEMGMDMPSDEDAGMDIDELEPENHEDEPEHHEYEPEHHEDDPEENMEDE
jgi:hypothetical protein